MKGFSIISGIYKKRTASLEGKNVLVLILLIILFCNIPLDLISQSKIESNFNNPFSRINRSEIDGKGSTIYSRVKSSLSSGKKYKVVKEVDTISYLLDQSLIPFDSLSHISTKDSTLIDNLWSERNAYVSRNKHEFLQSEDALVEGFDISIDSLSVRLDTASIREHYDLNQYPTGRLSSLDTALFSKEVVLPKSDSLLEKHAKTYLPDADTLPLVSGFDLVSMFRGENFTKDYEDLFKEERGALIEASKSLNEEKNKFTLPTFFNALKKNDFSNGEQKTFERIGLSSFFEYDASNQQVVLRPSLIYALSDRWRLGISQAVSIAIKNAELQTGQLGSFSQYDIGSFFVQLEWRNKLNRAEQGENERNETLVGLGKKIQLKGVSGNFVVLYNTNNQTTNKFTFQYGIDIL